MKLNIVTAASNSVWQAILHKIANPNDITIGLSRKGCDIANVLDCRITDLANKETTKQELSTILSRIDFSTIDRVRLFHNCCLGKYEFPQEFLQYIPEEYKNKVICQDYDGDGIDDWAYHSLITTFRNVFSTLQPLCSDTMLSIGAICSLTDKKKVYSEKLWRIVSPTIFSSMVKSNWILRDEIDLLAKTNKNIQSVCISSSTVKTQAEDEFRKYSLDKEYRVSGEMIADALEFETRDFANQYKDIDVFVPHPDFIKFLKETDEDLTKRQLFEITEKKL